MLSARAYSKPKSSLLRGQFEPLLEGLKLSELVEDAAHQDITFLSQELNTSTETIMRAAISARLEAAFQIPAPAFYAFLRQRVPAALPTPLFDASQNQFAAIEVLPFLGLTTRLIRFRS